MTPGCSHRCRLLLPATLLPILGCLCSDADASTAVVVADSVVIIGNGTPGPYWVTGFFALRGSETAVMGQRSLRADSDYVFDCNAGRITFTAPLGISDTIYVSFLRLSFPLSSRWTTERVSEIISTDDLARSSVFAAPSQRISPRSFQPVPSRSPDISSARSVRWQGYKSVAVSAGNQGSATMSQGLELALDGELTPGLQVKAALTDRLNESATVGANGGDGVRLGTLDRFFIAAESQRFRARWGELSAQTPSSRSPRRGTGLEAAWVGGPHALQGRLVRPEGEWVRRRIPLRAGDPGPYPLLGYPGSSRIVSGSQTVWLDGQRLSEGRDRDYTLDPPRATITLAPRVPVSDQSVLTVECERTLDSYRRTLIGADWDWANSADARRLLLGVDWESEDPSRPFFGVLTSQQRQILGGSPSAHVDVPSAQPVGEREGDYRLHVTEGGDSVFTYAGARNGDWDVHFSRVSSGAGRYRHITENVYEYVGQSAGDYEPKTTLTAPISRAQIRQSLDLTTGTHGRLQLGWRGEAVDSNRLASGQETFSADGNALWTLGKPDLDSGKPGFEVGWRHKGIVTARPNDPGIIGTFESYRRSFSGGLFGGYGDSIHEEYRTGVTMPYGRHAAGTTRLSRVVGRLFTLWGLSGESRTELGSLDLRNEWSYGLGQGRTASSPAEYTRGFSTTASLSGRLSTTAGWQEREIRGTDAHPQSRGRLPQYTAGRWAGVTLNGVTFSHRWETSREFDVSGRRRTRELSLQAPVSILRATSGSGLTMTRGHQSFASGPFNPYYRGQLQGRWDVASNLDFSLDMTLGNVRGGSQREIYLPTRAGEGQYRLERGEYIPDPSGDYRRVLVDDPDAANMVYDGDKRIGLIWRPHIHGWRWSFDVRRNTSGRFAAAAFRPGVWSIPWSLHTDAALPGAQIRIADAGKIVARPDDRWEMTMVLTRDQTRNDFAPADSAASANHLQWTADCRIRRQIDRRAYVEVAGEYDRKTRRTVASPSLDADARTLRFIVGGNPYTDVGISLEARRRIDREWVNRDRAALWGIRPGAQMRCGSFSARGDADLTWVSHSDGDLVLSPYLADGRPVGFSLTERAAVDWRLPGRITLTARMTGDHRRDAPDRWRFDLETVARF